MSTKCAMLVLSDVTTALIGSFPYVLEHVKGGLRSSNKPDAY
jgi:hypothetical protein